MKSLLTRNQRGETSFAGSLISFVIVIILAVIWMPIGASFVDDTKATRALTQLGFTDVTILNKDPWFVGIKGCGSGDGALYTVRGINPAGQAITVEVCAGIWKGGTIRS